MVLLFCSYFTSEKGKLRNINIRELVALSENVKKYDLSSIRLYQQVSFQDECSATAFIYVKAI